MRQIVCLSTTPWYAHPTRKQEVMRRLPDAEILYFDPPVTYIGPLRDKSLWPRLTQWKKTRETPQENITVYGSPPFIPFYNKKQQANIFSQWRLSRFVRKKMKEHGFKKPILWLYHPSSIEILVNVPYSSVVYDCVDNHAAYPGFIDPVFVNGMEGDLCKKADTIFTTAEGIYRRLFHYKRDRTHLIPNGANFDLFSKAADPSLPVPEDMKGISSPVLGFVGTLMECIDLPLVEKAARARPDWSFVFVGPVLPGVKLGALPELPNVHLLGPKPHEEVVSYIARFDVCLNLFQSNALSKDVSPLKFYEYLATGKPIVSTPEPRQVHDFKDVICLASDGDDFLRQCELALGESDPALTARRREIGKACSWDSRVAEIVEHLTENGVF